MLVCWRRWRLCVWASRMERTEPCMFDRQDSWISDKTPKMKKTRSVLFSLPHFKKIVFARANRKLLTHEVISHTRGLIDILAFRVPVQIRVPGFCARALAPWKICCVVVLLWFSRGNVVNWNSGVLVVNRQLKYRNVWRNNQTAF